MQTFKLAGHGHHGRRHHPEHHEHMKRIVEEENLDQPKNSVEFLEYVQKHQKKTHHHKRRLHKCSRVLMFVGVAMLASLVVRHMLHTRNMQRIERRQYEDSRERQYSGRHHRLGASATVEDTNAYGQTFNMISVAVWGLVVAKAKAGVEVAT
mmetsp:Transcript_20161/g.24879  ORF Transcript_20161/g.24879 Transcript_20161/m.24879 type:complete len:152 (-) Transcript_20161:1306-1761(-)